MKKNKLRQKREALGLRMIDVAIQSGVGISTLWLLENGYSEKASRKTKEKISRVLQTPVQELFPES